MADEANNQVATLRTCMNSEFEVIRFYLENIESLNYKVNKKALDELILGSVDHARSIIELFLKSAKNSSTKVNQWIVELAAKEEVGLQEIYQYEHNRTKNAQLKKLLANLAKEETKHQILVESLLKKSK